MSSRPANKGKSKYKYHRGGKRPGGPPRGGDGQGDFQGGPLAQYRSQPLPEMLSAPGISVTTVKNKEKTAEREIIEALEEAADVLYPETKEDAGEDDEGDIEDALKRELEGMKGGNKSKRFRLCRRDLGCALYVIVLEPLDPVKLVNHILEKCESTARCGLSYVQRLTPISRAGPGNRTTLAEMAAAILPEAFATPDNRGLKFAINAHVRNSDKLQRLEMIKIVAEEVTKLSPEHKVDLSHPDKTIIIDLFRNVVGMSIVENFEKYKKFNPSAVAKEAAKALGIETEDAGEKPQPPAVSASGIAKDPPSHSSTTPHHNTVNRERRAAGMVEAGAAREQAKEMASAAATKRKADEAELELEDGQLPRALDVERGEVVEDENAELGDEFQEVIEGGRATKMRREE